MSFLTKVIIPILIWPACVQPRPVTYTATPDAGYCAPNVGPKSPDDACDARFTPEGMACALCGVAVGCVSRDVMVYCVAGSCADPKCGVGKHR